MTDPALTGPAGIIPGALTYNVTLRSEWKGKTYKGWIAVEAGTFAGPQPWSVSFAPTLGIATVSYAFDVAGRQLKSAQSTGTSGGLAFDNARRVAWICSSQAAPPPDPSQGQPAVLRFALGDGSYGLSLYYCGLPQIQGGSFGWSLTGPEGGIDQGIDIAITGP